MRCTAADFLPASLQRAGQSGSTAIVSCGEIMMYTPVPGQRQMPGIDVRMDLTLGNGTSASMERESQYSNRYGMTDKKIGGNYDLGRQSGIMLPPTPEADSLASRVRSYRPNEPRPAGYTAAETSLNLGIVDSQVHDKLRHYSRCLGYVERAS